MSALQDRILLLFNRSPSWTGRRISQTLIVPYVMVLSPVRAMARKGWLNLRNSAGDITAEITTDGRAALADLQKGRTR